MEKNLQLDTSFSNDSQCAKCGGIGWILFSEDVPNYGIVRFGQRCPDCSRRRRAFDETGIPAQYFEADLPSFDFSCYERDMSDFKRTVSSFVSDFPRWEEYGMGLYLCSETPGSGKTLLACSIARSISLKHDVQIRFVTAADYLSAVGDSYHRDSGESDSSAIYRECRLLVVDDLGAQKSGDWQDQELFRLINARITAGKITVITSNVPQPDLKLDARTVDRIISCCLPLAFPEISIRRKQAFEKQQGIFRNILKSV